MNLTEKQLDWLRHMLGINDSRMRVPKPYRNHAAVGVGQLPLFEEMEEIGVVESVVCTLNTEYLWYRVTHVGKEAAIKSFKRIRVSAGKRRYKVYLDIADIYPDLTFKEFLTWHSFDEIRRNA